MDILSKGYSEREIAERRAVVRQAMLWESQSIRQPNFGCIAKNDLTRLFMLYDEKFFDSILGDDVLKQTGRPLELRLAPRMTRAGGKTILHQRRRDKTQVHYEIAVGTAPLFLTFDQIERPVEVCGLACGDRLDALQRIMEHEIIHLCELLIFGQSRCTGERFKRMAQAVFGHRGSTHALVTPREHAAVRHGVAPGDTVEFEFQGRRLSGRVNRIARRATVLVEDPAGMPYSDGKRYVKFYVPPALLSVS